MLRLSAIAFTVLAAAACLGGCAVHAGRAPEIVNAPASLREVVRTRNGLLMGASAPAGRAFLGVPYAAPPVGAFRFRPPQPVAAWREPRNATRPAAQCLQAIGAKSVKGGGGGLILGSEDCLYLNVYTPPQGAVRPTVGWPVMAFIPGGAFVVGTADNYDPSRLATSQGVVVVTLNYRLGALGFLAHPALRAESPAGGSGAFGLLDQQAALGWIADNIEAFGGDRANLTLFGESAGAWSTCYQMISPGAAGLFRRVILQSGACTDPRSEVRADEADRAGPAFADSLGCDDPATVLACLRRLPAARIARARPTRWGIGGPRSWGPVWGDPVVPMEPSAAFASGRGGATPAIVGTNRDEGRLFAQAARNEPAYEAQLQADFGVRAGAVLARYPAARYDSPRLAYAAVITDSRFACPSQALRNLLARRTPAYGYEFADAQAPFRIPTVLTGSMGAYHASELAYVFDSSWVLANVAKFTPAQRALSERIMNAWGRFARGEAPSPTWPVSAGLDGPVLTLQPDGDVLSTRFAERHGCSFWRSMPGR